MTQIAAIALLGFTLGPAQPADEPIRLEPLSYSAFQTRLAKNPPEVKLILVDAWATYCPPCMENFPHLVQMHHKYGSKGLKVISASFDDPEAPDDIAKAEKFLVEQKAVMTNVLIKEDSGIPYEKFDISAIPAVFLYTPDGKEYKRFTMDDPNNQFTYEDVEKAVAEYLK
jgi:thiol-disulfide isomerase/thioredoxin